jgi:two-component system response regulator DevR
MKSIRLLIVDDHEVVRVGLRSVLKRVPGFEVVADVSSAEEALEVVAEKLPDVVLMDVRMHGTSGVEACRMVRSKYPQVHVIMLTSYSDDEALVSSLLAGASGYVLKEVGCSELIEGIRTVAAGGSLLDPSVTGRVLQRLRGTAQAAEEPEDVVLTERERHILSLIAEGQTNKEIAHILNLSEKTVRNYVSSLLAKLKVNNRAEAAAHAVRENLVG